MNEELGREFEWEDEIENDGPEYVTLPEGVYDFEVISFERARYGGGPKIPACNQAIVSLRIMGEVGTTTIQHNLYLHSKCEGFLCNFFTAIGERKHGEKLKMNWNNIIGAKGRAKVVVDSWVSDKTGETMTSNRVKRFYEPEEATDTKRPSTGFKPGSF